MAEQSRLLSARIEDLKTLLRTRSRRQLRRGQARHLVHRLNAVQDRVRERGEATDEDRREVEAVAEQLGDVPVGPQPVRHVSEDWAKRG